MKLSFEFPRKDFEFARVANWRDKNLASCQVLILGIFPNVSHSFVLLRISDVSSCRNHFSRFFLLSPHSLMLAASIFRLFCVGKHFEA